MEDFRAVKQENPTSPWVDPNEEKCQIKFQAVVALETLNDLEKQREKDAVARNAAIKAANKEKRKREEERRQARKTGKLLVSSLLLLLFTRGMLFSIQGGADFNSPVGTYGRRETKAK